MSAFLRPEFIPRTRTHSGVSRGRKSDLPKWDDEPTNEGDRVSASTNEMDEAEIERELELEAADRQEREELEWDSVRLLAEEDHDD